MGVQAKGGAFVEHRQKRRIRYQPMLLGLATLLVVTGAWQRQSLAQERTMVVTTTDDELNADGDCSLREAIVAVNRGQPVDGCAAGAGTNVIVLTAGIYTLTNAGPDEDAASTGDLDVRASLVLHGDAGGGAVLDGAGLDRVLDVQAGSALTVTNLLIQNGMTRQGGGIRNAGLLRVEQSTIRGNVAFDDGGGVWSSGGLVLDRSTVGGNSARNGGGLYTSGTAGITASTLSEGTAERGGGVTNNGELSIVNSTLSGNTAGAGAAIANGGVLSISSSTLVNNHSSSGVETIGTGSTILENSLLAVDGLSNGSVPPSTGRDCSGTMLLRGVNLIQNPTGCILTGARDQALLGVAPLVGPLAMNGGPTATHALLQGSPAIDAAESCPPTDQRGAQRPQNGSAEGVARCDIGAYELVSGGDTPYPAPHAYLPVTKR